MKFLSSILLGLLLWLAPDAHAQNSIVTFGSGQTLMASQLNDLQKGLVSTQGGASTGQALTTPTLTNPTATGGTWLDMLTLGMEGAQTITASPVGIGARTVKSSLFVDDTVTDGTTSVWPHVIQTTSATGTGAVDPIWGGEADRINMFLGMKCLQGSSACWAENQLLYAGAGFVDSAHGVEIDIENYSSDRGSGNPINGLEITGGSQYPATYGMDIVGNSGTAAAALFHTAIGVLAGAASDNSFFDTGSATESLHILGTHAIGLDFAYATITGSAVLLDTTQSLNFHNKTSGATTKGLSSDGANVIVGSNAPSVLLGAGGIAATSAGALSAPTVQATSALVAPVVTAAPSGSCPTYGAIEVSGTGMHVCVAGTWKTATLQ